MLYHFFYGLVDQYSFFNVFKYITFRALLSGLTAFFLCMILSPWFIRKMRKSQVGQVIRDDGPQTHLKKAGTPTMGGGLILSSIFISVLLWADLTNPYILILNFVLVYYGILGWFDDWLKISKKNTKGVSGKVKLLFQFIGALIFILLTQKYANSSTYITVPFIKNFSIDLSYFFIPFVMLVMTGTSNAVNLTDGLDGLAIGPVMTTTFTFMIIAYASGHFGIAEYLQIPYIEKVGEIIIFGVALVMAGMGFLWFNSYPAQVFMGDVGSLSLGAIVSALAIFTHNEILLVIVGGVFVLEALSVMIQVGSFKIFGKRVFRMAPLHHHYELKGWSEPKIIVRFWIISILLSILGLVTLKLR